MTARVGFELHRDWKTLSGPVLGLSQPLLVGIAGVALPEGFDPAALEAEMRRFLEDEQATGADGGDPAQRLVANAIQWAGTVQRRHNVPVSEFFGIEPIRADNGSAALFRVYVPYLAREAARIALDWVEASLQQYLTRGQLATTEDRASARVRRQLARSFAPYASSPNSARFIRAAQRLRVPVVPLTGNLIQFGFGRNSRLLADGILDTTSVVGAQIVANKAASAVLLRRAGLPAPTHSLVADADAAARAAERFGYPVVVKPADRAQGIGVAAGLTSEEAVRAAYAEAVKHSESILVERHFPGRDYRLTIFAGDILQVSERGPAGVTGDGNHTLAELVEIVAAVPENRRRERESGCRLLVLDDEAIALAGEAGLTPDSVVAEARFVPLRRRAGIAAGRATFAVPLEQVHPDNLELARRAAEATRVNLAGVDLIIADIARSWLEIGALICEVDVQPQIGRTGSIETHAKILRSILGPRPAVPIAAYISAEPPAGLADLALDGREVAVSSAAGITIAGKPVVGPQASAFAAATMLASHPGFDLAVIHLTPGDITEHGLPFLDCDAAVIAADALGQGAAVSWLLPHVRGEVILPEAARAGPPRTRPDVQVGYSDDPWPAAQALVVRLLARAPPPQ